MNRNILLRFTEYLAHARTDYTRPPGNEADLGARAPYDYPTSGLGIRNAVINKKGAYSTSVAAI